MVETERSLSVTLDENSARKLHELIVQDAESRSSVVKRSNLGGDAATWIVIATLSAQVLPHVLTFIMSILETGNVKRYKIGDIEVENPGEKDLVLLRELAKSRNIASSS